MKDRVETTAVCDHGAALDRLREQETVARESERTQAESHDLISEDYERHATDPVNVSYRRRFIDGPALAGIQIEGRLVIEAFSGSGYSTGHLLERGARPIGLDISHRNCRRFRKKWQRVPIVRASAVRPPFAPCTVDVVLVVGGLHHVRGHIDETLEQWHSILRPGGWLCFYEPHRGSIPDVFRRLWYRLDPLFTTTEESIDIDELHRLHGSRFEFASERFVGSIAYLLVLNSLVFRMPGWMKQIVSGPLMAIEALLDRLLGRRLSCAVVAQWKRL